MKREEALFDYTWDEIQDLVLDIPIKRIVAVAPGMQEHEIREAYLDALCDRDVEAKAREVDAFVERARARGYEVD